MLKTLRFYGKFTLVLLGSYMAFVAVILGGAFLTGLDGLFGTYVSMLPSMGVLFVGIFALSGGYLEVALSMGARRIHCFWAAEICNLAEAAVMLLVAMAARRLLAGLPDPDGVLYNYGPKGWLTVWLVGAVTLQTGLLVGQITDPRKKVRARVLMLFSCMALMVGVTVSTVIEVLDNALVGGLWPAWLVWLVSNLPLVLAGMAVLLAVLVYLKYRKAVVLA